MNRDKTTVQELLLKALNVLGLVAGIVIIIIAIPSSLKGFALLLAGLVIAGANIYWLLKRRKSERLALEGRGDANANSGE